MTRLLVCVPDDLGRDVLHAALDPPDSAVAAWHRVRPRLDLTAGNPRQELYRLLPLVYRNLPAGALDEPDRAALAARWSATRRDAEGRVALAAHCIARLRSGGVAVSVLKGVPLALRDYGDLGSRPMQDVDLLVPREQVDPALDLLEAAGWCDPAGTARPVQRRIHDSIKDCEGDRARGADALRKCAEKLMSSRYQVPQRLKVIYKALLKPVHNHVVVMSYMDMIVPYYPVNNYKFGEWRAFADALNNTIASTVTEVKKEVSPAEAARLHLVSPVRVISGAADNSGPVECKRKDNTFRADGSSVLADIVQSDLSLGSFANRFCGKGAQYKDGNTFRDAGGAPWFNSQDLGTHLTRAGNAQLARAALAKIKEDGILPGAPKGAPVDVLPREVIDPDAVPDDIVVLTPEVGTSTEPAPEPTEEPQPAAVEPNRCVTTIVNSTPSSVVIDDARHGEDDRWAPALPKDRIIPAGTSVALSAEDPPPGPCRIELTVRVDRRGSRDPQAEIVTALERGTPEATCSPTGTDIECEVSEPPRIDGSTLTTVFTLRPA